MSRVEEALLALRDWVGECTAAQLSVELSCAPAQAGSALDALVQRGDAVRTPEDRYRAEDVCGEILKLLTHAAEHRREYTPIGVAEALPYLHLTEAQALVHLTTLAADERAEVWFSLPNFGDERALDQSQRGVL